MMLDGYVSKNSHMLIMRFLFMTNNMKLKKQVVLFLFLSMFSQGVLAQSQVVEQWAEDPAKSNLVDFSYAGYKQSESKPELVPSNYKKFNVLDYGAIPDDDKDDIDAIQKAVDAAAAAGGGVVIIPKGVFDFDVNTKKRFVHIRNSNIIILGAGEGNGGTVLHDHTASDYFDPNKKWLGGLWPSFFLVSTLKADSVWVPYDDKNNVSALLGDATKHAITIPLDKAINVEVGKTYLLTMESADNELTKELIFPLDKAGKYWWSNEGSGKYKVQQLVRVIKKDAKSITLDAPLLWELKKKYKPTLWQIPIMIENVAIAGMKMTTDWSEPFVHHLNSVHDGGWSHIRMSYCENAWVQNTIHENTTGAVAVDNSKNCSVWHARIIGNIGHNGFIVSGFSTRNLLYNLHGGQSYHTFALSSYSSGNVYFNCYSKDGTAIDLHGGVGVHNLYDNIFGSQFKHGGSPNALPPATGHGFVLWNFHVGLTEPYKGVIKNSLFEFHEVPGFVAVGVQGDKGQLLFILDENGKRMKNNYTGDWGQLEYWGREPQPASLFQYQFEKRLGKEIQQVLDIN